MVTIERTAPNWGLGAFAAWAVVASLVELTEGVELREFAFH